MKSFSNKVKQATTIMGKAPYDDQKTFKAVSDATQKVVLHRLKGKADESKAQK